MPALAIDTASSRQQLIDVEGVRSARSRHGWWLYLLGGALFSGAYTLAHVSGPSLFGNGLVFNLIGGSSVAALIVGARTNCGRRLPWYLLAIGQGLFVTSDVLAYNYPRLFGGPMPFPSIADPFHLAFYPFLVVGMLALIRERSERRDRAALIDSLIVTLALATLLWVYLIAPYSGQQTLSTLGRLTSIAYPAMDILVLAVVARVASGSHRREPAFAFLLSSAVVLLLSDALYGWRLMGGGTGTGVIMHAGWATYYVLMGTAALHPSMRLLSTPGPEADGHLTRARLALLTCASLTVPLLIMLRDALHESLDLYVLVGSSSFMFALVLARMAGIVSRNEDLALQMVSLTEQSAQAALEHQAFHDALTGLPNRALFRNRVAHALASQRRDRLPVAVLILDVDDFKHVNDGLGPAAGDEVLQEVARRLQDCMRPVDTAARLGGDEF
ncbi:MAG TPA: GGDEF domain-containing protein, partial [Solirubrobacteraceae bacterium]|nr:GGDEF domain-containing protein [Solirubrobacteraceae bacterium]